MNELKLNVCPVCGGIDGEFEGNILVKCAWCGEVRPKCRKSENEQYIDKAWEKHQNSFKIAGDGFELLVNKGGFDKALAEAMKIQREACVREYNKNRRKRRRVLFDGYIDECEDAILNAEVKP